MNRYTSFYSVIVTLCLFFSTQVSLADANNFGSISEMDRVKSELCEWAKKYNHLKLINRYLRGDGSFSNATIDCESNEGIGQKISIVSSRTYQFSTKCPLSRNESESVIYFDRNDFRFVSWSTSYTSVWQPYGHYCQEKRSSTSATYKVIDLESIYSDEDIFVASFNVDRNGNVSKRKIRIEGRPESRICVSGRCMTRRGYGR